MSSSLKQSCLLTTQTYLPPTVILLPDHYIKYRELNKLSTWFAANVRSLNLSKTNFMVFKP